MIRFLKIRCLQFACATSMLIAAPAFGQQSAPKPKTLFTNVHVFDGKSEQRIENAKVLIEGNLIKSVSTDPIEADGATVIDGGGRTLMPRLNESQVHL